MKKLFSSNSIEVLARELQSQIVGNSTFFTNNYIIVPNKQVKNWLMLFFAKQSQENIAMNLSFYNANRVIDLYQNISKKKVSEKYFDYLELNFYIEQKIVSIINNFEKLSIEEKKIIQPLLNYLDFNGSFSKKSKNRLVSLCEELTDQFLKYGIYAKEILEETSIDNWQRHLWKEIFIKEKKLFPLRDLKVENLNIREGNFYFFALSHLPSIFFDLSINFSEVNHFILSPCLHFWEDICSDYERKSIEKQWKRKKITKSTKEDLQFYLKERNPLLANMGRELRKYLKETGNYENLNIYEDYQNKEIEYLDWENGICNKSFLLLEGVQLDLLFMRNPEKSEPINLDKNDNSIEIHGANSKLREIEILHDNILRMVAKEGVDLSEILVLSPEIKEYEPYIKLVFDGNENYLDYKISDIDLSSQSFFIRGLFDLFFLYSSKWDFSSVKSLFENPFFQSKHLLSKEEVFQIFKWFEKTNLSWGIEAKHRIEKLEPKIEISKEDLELGTWEYSIKRILFGFVFMMNQKEIMGEFNYEPPIEGLDLSQGDILNKFLKAFNQLKENISFINEEHFLIDWNKFLLNLAKENFEISGADNNENNAYQQYLFFAERLKDIGTDLKDQKFSFCTIFNHFKREIYHKKTSINSNEVSAVQFCSILSGAVIPKKVKYLIGMNDEYPKSEYLNSLKLFKLENEPSNVEKQRMAFLNILITTKEKLLISFISENENCFPSIFIQELQSYLDRAYTINRKEPSKEIVNIHPAFSFDKRYFQEERLQTFSQKNYLAAKVHYNNLIVEEKNFPVKEIEKNEITNIYIKDLINFAKHPVKFYFNKVLDIYFEQEEKDEFKISFLDKYLIRESSFNMNVEEVIKAYQKQGKFPAGIFTNIEKKEILKDIKRLHNNLTKFSITKEEITNVEFSMNLENSKMEEKRNIFPNLALKIKEKEVKITGFLPNVTTKGLLSYSDSKLTNLIKVWPSFLIYSTLPMGYEKRLLFLKDGKEKSLNIGDIDHYLKIYVEYFINSHTQISPLITEWASAFFKKENSVIEKKNNFNAPFEDLYSTWAISNQDQIFKERGFREWGEYFNEIFSPLIGEKE